MVSYPCITNPSATKCIATLRSTCMPHPRRQHSIWTKIKFSQKNKTLENLSIIKRNLFVLKKNNLWKLDKWLIYLWIYLTWLLLFLTLIIAQTLMFACTLSFYYCQITVCEARWLRFFLTRFELRLTSLVSFKKLWTYKNWDYFRKRYFLIFFIFS